MMQESFEKIIFKKIHRLEHNHFINYFWTTPVKGILKVFFGIVKRIAHNRKKLSIMAASLLALTLYSSFSLPVFNQNEEGKVISAEPNLPLPTPEVVLDLEDILLVESGDVIDDEFDENSIYENEYYENEDNQKITAEDILSLNQQLGTTEKDNADTDLEHAFSKDDWRLVLVNKQNSIPADYAVKLGNIKTLKGVLQCDERVIDDLLAMFSEAKKDGVTLAISSPYRKYQDQRTIFNKKVEKYLDKGWSYLEAYKKASQIVTLPGASEHQLGLSFDIVTDDYISLNAGFAKTSAGIWLAENSSRFGFILRYPEDKEYITCIEYEPWHFRYVGLEAAQYMTENHLTLEEFWEEVF